MIFDLKTGDLFITLEFKWLFTATG